VSRASQRPVGQLPIPDALGRSFSVLLYLYRMNCPGLWAQCCASSFWKPSALHGVADIQQRTGGVIIMRLGTAKEAYFFRPLELDLGTSHSFLPIGSGVSPPWRCWCWGSNRPLCCFGPGMCPIPRQHEAPRLMWAFIRESATASDRSYGCPAKRQA
jgi:hypothetical protein